MTKLEREKYLLELNTAQRLALLLSISCHFSGSENLSEEDFEQKLTSYKIESKSREGGPKKRKEC